jgi:hypothetical protein
MCIKQRGNKKSMGLKNHLIKSRLLGTLTSVSTWQPIQEGNNLILCLDEAYFYTEDICLRVLSCCGLMSFHGAYTPI